MYIEAMGLASVIPNGVQTPFKFDSFLLRISSISPLFHLPRLNGVQFTCSHTPSFHTVRHRHRNHHSPIACSRGIKQEDDLSSSEGETTSSPSYNDTSNLETLPAPTSIGNQEEKSQRHESYVSSVRTVALCVCTAVAFGVGLGLKDGVGKASEFFAGYLLEQSLSVDNLFVFVLIFKYFQVPIMYQSRVLSYGIAGAVVFRLSLILLGTATLQRFEAVNLLLAAILLYSSFKLFAEEEEDNDLSNNFIVKTCQKFIPVTSKYDGDRFLTFQDGVWKASNILGRPHLYFSQSQFLSSVI